MARHHISDIDKKVNKSTTMLSLERALANIEKYIVKYIDSDFDTKAFREWLDSDDDKPFRCNNHRYYWQ